MLPLVLGEIGGVFLKTLRSDGKYPVLGSGNLQLRIEIQLSGKKKKLSDFFVPFLESTSNFKHFEKKDDSRSYFIWQIRHCARVG